MTDILIFIAAVVLVGQAIIGLAFFISCIWEREVRATVFAGIQFLGMAALVVLFFFIRGAGFFESTLGLALLIAGLISGIFITFLLMRKSGTNPKALEGTNLSRHHECGNDPACRFKGVHVIAKCGNGVEASY